MREYCMRWLISIPLLILLGGCADLGYYWHSANGHLDVMQRRVDIDDLLADDSLDTGLRERLELVREIRTFSVTRLALPDNDSYLSYAELDRPWLIRNLFAAPEFSTRLHQWCYPIIGCAGYRGYYDEKRLQGDAEALEAEGFEIHVGNVAAYSTLGWFDDPVLSTFVNWPDYRLAGLLFHELTHQQLYIDDDTTFNESLASAVQQAGTELWLRSRNRDAELARFNAWLDYRGEVVALIAATREDLEDIYRRDIGDADKRGHKAALFEQARITHGEIAGRHGIEGGFSAWFAGELNNAKIGSVAAYNLEVPAFLNMLRAHGNDFGAFYLYVEKVGALDRDARDRCLAVWRERASSAAPCPPGGRAS